MYNELRAKVERDSKFSEHFLDMPFIELREGYSFQVNPPTIGACFRFHIKHTSKELPYSIYYDSDDSLGSVGRPYYEVYPVGEDSHRFFDIEDLLWFIYDDCEDANVLRKEAPDRYI